MQISTKFNMRQHLRASTVIPLGLAMATVGGGATFVVLGGAGAAFAQCAANPCAANPCAANPCAANPCAANPCAANPCAANPCAANPCAANPCAANPCAANPCAANPCAANPCAANPCAANPCAANPCAANPCAANPCAANPCAANPCAASSAGASTGCFVPRLQNASANPCAANPCAANPCAANPCAANPCAANPCAANPCAASAAPPELEEAELQALYSCLIDGLTQESAEGAAKLHDAAWLQSDNPGASDFADWQNFARTPYISFTHGERFAFNHANDIAAEQYGLFEDVEAIPAGGIIAKPTFSVSGKGEALLETLFLMEKAPAGTMPDTNDWIYSAVMSDGSLMGRTNGQSAQNVEFCVACHQGGGYGQDDLMFLEEEYRF